MKKKKKRWLIWSSVILVVVIVVAALAMSNGSEEKKNGRATVKVEKKNIIDKALAVGSIEPVNEIDGGKTIRRCR